MEESQRAMQGGDLTSGQGVHVGDVLAGKYRVERVLGAGGMGVVVLAHHIMLDEKVALKFLLPEAAANLDAVARFLREARAAARIKNEHVARVSDVGQLDNGSPFIVMEYLDGGDLAAWLAERGPLPIDLAVDFVLHACEAIAEAHALGIVHRDLKPANLFCVKKPDGTLSVKVLDFGISKLMIADALPQQLTTTGTFMGSPRYMSPEQMKLSKAVDGRTDIWSLGIILFELLAGVAPFDAEGVTDLAIKVATEAAASLRTYREDAPAALEAVVVRCLEKDRESRYQTIAEMALALEPFGTSRARASVLGIVGTLRQAAHSAENRGPIAAPAGPQPPKMVASDGPLPVVRREERPVVGATTAEPVATERGATPRRAGRRNDRRWVLACALLLLAGGGVAAAVGIASKEQPSTASARGAAPDSTPGRAEPAAASADPGAWTEAPPSVSTGASMPTRVPSTVPVPPRVRAASSAPVGPSPEPLRALPAPSAECDPPTWQDERGHIHLKKGCR